jgi:DNA-binding transcriptional LysR family regulator
MELRQLRYFIAVAEESHFGRAANRLLIASPSLSQQIKALETRLGVRLFDRSSRGASLTAEGERLLPHARATVAASEQLLDEAQRLSQGRHTALRLGFLAYALTASSRSLLVRFGRRHPHVDVDLRQYEWDDPSAGLLDGTSDIALVRTPFNGESRLRTVEVASEPVLAVMAEGHELATATSISAARLAQETFIEAGQVTDPVFAAYWYLWGQRPDDRPVARSRSTTVEEWLGEIAMGRGVNIVPAGLAAEYQKPGLVFVPVDDLPPSRLVVAWNPAAVTPAALDFARLAARPAAR